MNKEVLKSKMEEVVKEIDLAISCGVGQTRESKELIKWRNELKGLIRQIDKWDAVDWPVVCIYVYRLIDIIISICSN